jgi:hypothetical protein
MSEEWIGGIPNVGDRFEYQAADSDPEKDHWFKGKATYKYGRGDEEAIVAFCDHLGCEQGLQAYNWKFRPIKPSEETEREDAITEIVNDVLDGVYTLHNNQEIAIAEHLYDAGYRKQGEVVDYDSAYASWCASTVPLKPEFFKYNYIITRKL